MGPLDMQARVAAGLGQAQVAAMVRSQLAVACFLKLLEFSSVETVEEWDPTTETLDHFAEVACRAADSIMCAMGRGNSR